MGVLPGGRGNDFARVVGHPARRRGGLRRDRATARPTRRPRRRRRRARSSGSRRSGSTPTPTGSPTRRRRASGTSSTPTARCGARGLEARRATRSWSTARRAPFSGWSVACANSKALRRRHVPRARRRPARRPARRRLLRAPPARRGSCAAAAVFKGEHVKRPDVHVLRGTEVRISADRPFTRLRRRRPDRRAPVHGPGDPERAEGAAAGVRASELAARAAGAASRADRARRDVAAREGAAAHGAARDRAARRAPLTSARPLGDEREDDDRGDGRPDPRARRAHARAQPRRGEHGRRRRDRAAARPTATPGLFEVDEFWLAAGPAPELRPRALLLGNLFRDQLDRYGELETIAERWADALRRRAAGDELVLNADDPLVADLGPRPRRRPVLRRRGRRLALARCSTPSDAKHCRRCGAPYVYDADLPRPPRPLPLPQLRRAQAGAAVAAHRHHARRHPRRRVRAAHAAGVADVALPLPGLYNVYNALAAAGAGAGARRAAGRRRGGAAGGRAGVRPRRDACGSAAATCRSCS